jgi:hypothetical protein
MAVIWTEGEGDRMEQQRQQSRERQRDIYIRAGRTARLQGRPITCCPNLKQTFKSGMRDVFGEFLEDQWKKGWYQQDDELRQRSLFPGTESQ